MATISSNRFAAIIEAARLKKAQKLESSHSQESQESGGDGFTQTMNDISSSAILSTATDKNGASITYNSRQQEFISLSSTHKSCILIGAAGTGKTTCMKGTVTSLIHSPHTGILQNHDHKHLPNGVPGIVICAYTRRATNNIRRNMDVSMQSNCLTIHKLLEYSPVYYQIIDENGNDKNTMKFEPTRNALNPLPAEITTIIFEESSMIGTALYQEVVAAIPDLSRVQIIFLGDIQQLPPVFGAAILGFKMLELPTVELTEVYRQALESPIIRLAHRILSGTIIAPAELPSWNCDGLTIKPWKKKIDAESALNVSAQLFSKLYDSSEYDPLEDMILIPFNKAYGTLELNKSIANHIARTKSLVTYEIVSGFIKHYLSVGDKVLYDREDAVVLEIYPNPSYTGMPAQKESTYLDYWGHNNTPRDAVTDSHREDGQNDIDFILGQVTASDEDRVTQSSHCIKLLMQDTSTERTITKAAEINALILGYALTVHKAQGSEWDKVFVLLHNSHATMLQRELLYTAVTRAKKDLFVICEGDTFTTAVKSQKIKGNTLAEKAVYFQGKLASKGDMQS